MLLGSCNAPEKTQNNGAPQPNARVSEDGPTAEDDTSRGAQRKSGAKNEAPEAASPGAVDELATATTESTPMPPPPAPVKVWPRIGIRNFASAMSTMSFLTGIPKTNPRVLIAYNANKGSLPSDAYADNLTNSSVVGLYKVSSTVCDELTKDPAARAAMFGTFNFAGLPQAVLGDQGKRQVAEAIVLKFWGKDLAKLPAHDTNIAMVTEVLNELLALNPANTADITLKVVSGTCTAALMTTQAMSY
jgi:hypothetical protein